MFPYEMYEKMTKAEHSPDSSSTENPENTEEHAIDDEFNEGEREDSGVVV